MTQVPTKIWWVRHLPVEVSGFYMGRTDVEAVVPASEANILSLLPEDAVWYSSPLKRTVTTAQYLQTQSFQKADALQEQHFGDWEGRSYDEVWKESEHSFDWSKPELVKPAQGENFADVCDRLDGWLDRTLKTYSGENIVVVAHAGVIRAGIRHALNLSPAQALSFQLDNLSVTHMTYFTLEPVSARVEYVNRL
jgi:alpha-ribazole phosphatase